MAQNVATIKPNTIAAVRLELNSAKMREQLSMALPNPKILDRFNRNAITAISNNPDLLNADRRSLFSSIMQAAQLGLIIDGFLGEGHLAIFKGKVQFIPGYRGLLKLARQSGEIKSIDVDTIHENDAVEMIGGDDSRFSIKIDWRNRGEIIGAYAISQFKDGGIQRAIMTLEQIEAIRKAAFSGNSPAWRNHRGEMYKKTAFRRLSKMLPLSTEAQDAMAMSDAFEADQAPDTDQAPFTGGAVAEGGAPKSGQSRLDRLAEDQAPADDGVVDAEAEEIPGGEVPPPNEQDLM